MVWFCHSFFSSAFIYQAVCLKSSTLSSTLSSRHSTEMQSLQGEMQKGSMKIELWIYVNLFCTHTSCYENRYRGKESVLSSGNSFGQFYCQMSKDFSGSEGNCIFSPLFTASILHPLLASSHNRCFVGMWQNQGGLRGRDQHPVRGVLPWTRDSYHRPLCG